MMGDKHSIRPVAIFDSNSLIISEPLQCKKETEKMVVEENSNSPVNLSTVKK